MQLTGYPIHLTLKNRARVLVRPMEARDGPALLAFFRAIPLEDRLYLREDVTREEVVQRFVTQLNYEVVLPLLALDQDRIVGDGTLHRNTYGWSAHVGKIRVVVARDYQRLGLGTGLARLLVKQAIAVGLDKLVAEVVDNQIAAKRAFEKLGFCQEAVLKRQVCDIHGRKRDLVLLANDVSHIWDHMEAMVRDVIHEAG